MKTPNRKTTSPLVICRNAAEVPRNVRRRRGFALATCAACGTDVVVSPSTRALLDEGALALCVSCSAGDVLRSGQSPTLVLSAEAAIELQHERRRYAQRHGVAASEVAATLPPLLTIASDAVRRMN